MISFSGRQNIAIVNKEKILSNLQCFCPSSRPPLESEHRNHPLSLFHLPPPPFGGGGGGGDGYFWRVVSRGHRRVSVVDTAGRLILVIAHRRTSWCWLESLGTPLGCFYTRKAYLQQRFHRSQVRCWSVSRISSIDPWNVVLALHFALCVGELSE